MTTENPPSAVMKSVSEGELGVEEVVKSYDTKTRDSGSKLKRTFTLPRNLLQSATRMSKRRMNKSRDPKDVSSAASAKENSKNNVQQQQQQQQYNTVDNSMQQNVGRLHGGNNQQAYHQEKSASKKVFVMSSWKKFIKIMQHMSNVGTQNKNSHRDELSSSATDIRVPPPRPAHIPPDRVPGVIGLRNHGNTCFMNAVLQCLSHTDILAEYFVLDQYKVDLSRRNKLNSKKYGTKGEITEQLALLLKAIWSCQYDPEMSTAFKSVVDKYGSQYRGNLQHDAQEFLLWLLDKVHEDLNQATKKKYKIIKNSFGRPDEIVAAETLANHNRCNNSFVHDVFQAQFRSSLTCPRCHRQSNTFDPFLCVSVPVPQNHRQMSLFVNVLYTSQQPRQVRIGVTVNQAANVRELREILASDTGIEENHMLLTEVHDEGFHRTFSDCQPLSVITENDPLYCIELPQLKEPTEQAYILLVWINVLVKGDLRQRFGSPYTMQVSRETSYEDLQKLLLKEMHSTLTDDVLTSSQNPGLFNIRVADPAATPIQDEHPCIDPCVEHPLYTEQIEQALALCADDSGPQHVKLILEWDEATKNNIIQDDSDQIEEHASVKQLKTNSELGGAVTLEECFDLYTRAETLGAEDAWHCPYCNKKQEVVKKLGLWTLPDILVIHLKRFRQQSKQRSTSKLTMLVDFPLYGFDMTPHLAHNGVQTHNNVPTLGGLGWSPWKKPRPRQQSISKYDENVYDLYAICNHHGQDLQGGHYTAFCRNPYDTQWYCFDDTRVEAVNDTNLITNAAYMLFYQRRGLTSNSTGNSSAASTSSAGSGLDHWVSKMPPFYFNNKTSCNVTNNKQSKSQEILCQEKIVEEKNMNNFNRGSRNYATLQPKKRNVATETDAGHIDHCSDDEAPCRREWASPKPVRKTSSITLTPHVPVAIIQNANSNPDTTVIHESTL
ncbi:ubiquitin carboxyl-terminal hydrolase 31 isoform X1 [Vespa velutina]|uniref:ubiquitin carboxyl-terminal hydrolase 31 isoform X1 n=1 Tax=Vespa crabro TaxID=7445 RepID=UPI001F00F563|nr:ubiquitin carboxyl-terminal hydrolase 31 isoform X1 [Vespa crabro]XP_047347011.1 ubiquitin carboxyl-terminal hydrolase 31 isoform X1 [Vespa velutina]